MNGYKLSAQAARAAQGLPPLPVSRQPVKISHMAVALANRAPAAPSPMAMDAASIYAPYKFPEGVYPADFAMDEACGPVGGLPGWASQALFHEGQGFFGFPYLAELFQRSEYRNACEIWAEHSVRKWIKFVDVDDAKKDELESAFKELRVRDTFYRWALQDHEYGRGQIFLDFGDFDDPKELGIPLLVDGKKINPKRPLQRLTIVEPFWCAPGGYITNNPLNPKFYKPFEWFAYGVRVDASRLLTLVSRPVSDMLKPAYAFGGQALTQIMKPYVDNWLRSRQSSSDLLDAHSQPVLKTDMSAVMSGDGGEDMFRRIDMFQNTRNNRGVLALDKDAEDFAFVTTPLSGVSDLVAQALEQVCVAARIPQSIYLQNQPTGLNASSEGELRSFYGDVHAYQEKNFRPGLKVILDLVQLSLWGKIDPTIDFHFVELWEMSEKDRADIQKLEADTRAVYVNLGAVDPDEVRESLDMEDDGIFAGVDLTGEAPGPPIDPINPGDGPGDDDKGGPVGDADGREDDHPRAPDGKFGSGGGSGASAKKSDPKPAEPAKTPTASPRGERQPNANVIKTLGPEGTERLRALINDPNSKASDILDALEPLDAESASRQPTIAEGQTPDVDFWSKRQYDLDGKPGGYVEAIDALRDKATSYAGPGGPKRERKARILLGPPAAGKSTSAEKIAADGGYAIVDGDDAKKVIPEFEGGIGASATQEESSLMSARVLKSMTDDGSNVILPLVGAKAESIEKRVKALQDAGYSVTVYLVDVSQDNAVRRMGSRALYTGRHIASSYARSIGNGPLET